MLQVEDVGKKEQRNQEKILSINSVSFVLFYFFFPYTHGAVNLSHAFNLSC